MTEFLAVGKVKDAHGLKGEVYISLFSKEASWLKRLKEIRLQPETPDQVAVFPVKSVRQHKDGLIVLSPEICGRNQAESLKGRVLEIPREFLVSKKGEAPFLIEVLGFSVDVESLGLIGEVTGFSSNIAQDLLVISGPELVYEVPFVDAFVVEVNYALKKISMKLPEGLLEVVARPPA